MRETPGRLITDTSNIFAIQRDDEIVLGKHRYRVTGHVYEQRFGIDDPKVWVKRVEDCETGEKKILKLAYLESFKVTVGGVDIRCFRNPEKEGEILELVQNHPNFMQGTSCRDQEGHTIRVLDIVQGPNYYVYLDSIQMPYASYFTNMLPALLRNMVKAFEAIRFLHIHDFRHGDIRNDHLIIDSNTGHYVWIDFDYDFESMENRFSLDIFGMGNLILYTVGKGFHTYYEIKNNPYIYKDLLAKLEPDDFALLDKQRLVNLKKLYPQIPNLLNNVLMHFSRGAEVYYEFAEEVIEDLNKCIHAHFI
jgi:hypothetical protein